MVLEPMTESDFADYLAMKSDPQDILWAGFAGPPGRDFREWFLRALEDQGRRMFIARDGHAVGYLVLRGDEISYGVHPRHRGKGYGCRMLALVQGVAWCAEDNALSLRALANAGYRDAGERKQQEFLLPAKHLKTMRLFSSPGRQAVPQPKGA